MFIFALIVAILFVYVSGFNTLDEPKQVARLFQPSQDVRSQTIEDATFKYVAAVKCYLSTIYSGGSGNLDEQEMNNLLANLIFVVGRPLTSREESQIADRVWGCNSPQ